ncbi:ABC transporter permease subunit [Anaerotignum sp.]
MFDLIISTLTQGFIYALLSYGIYITYKILDFPDLTVDGSFPLGAAIAAVLLVKEVNPFVALLAAIAVGAVAGLVTGVIHVKFGVRDLLAGIITMTALFSINLQIAGSNLAVERAIDTIFTSGPIMAVMGNASLMMRKFVMSLVVALVFKFILDWYLSTKSGMLLRAVGDNSMLVTTLAKDKGIVKIVGLVIANALVALSGAMVCMEQRAFSSTMGTGQMVFGLAAVIIGTTLFRKVSFVKGTTAVLVGSVFYKACIQIAISLGLPANLMKLATAVLFLIILILGNRQKGGAEHA